MKRLFWALLCFVPIFLQGQNKNIYFSSNSPENIPYGKPFDLFTVIKFPETEFDETNLYIMSENRFSVQDVTIFNSGSIMKMKGTETEFGNYSQAYKINISRTDSLFDFSSVFRFKYSFAQLFDNQLKIHFAVEFLKDGKAFQVFNSFSKNQAFSPAVISFYKPQQIAGRCLLMQEGAGISLTAEPQSSSATLLTEFWMKTNNLNSEFMKIRNAENGKEYLSLALNENNFFYLNDFGRTYYTGLSLSKNAWYHFAVLYTNNRVNIYCNGKLVHENNTTAAIPETEIRIIFSNESPDSYLYLKQLRLWNFHDDIEKCFANRRYSFYSAENSELLYQNLFNDEIYSKESGGIRIYDSGRLRIVQCDAPIISRAPDINITVFSSSCSIEWSNRDYQKPKNFIVEKSNDGSSFTEVFKTTADEDPNKIYYYSDKRDASENVNYYRVKQINYDGSEVYSSSLKVGQSSKKEKIKVGQNYPNPFNPSTSFTVEMLETSEAVITVYDLVGKTIKTLHEGTLTKGVHTFNFEGSSLPSGIYFYEIKTPASSIVRKMILTK